ncbi:hypothetical protein J3459_003969 [Metarhizium acridum]|nr:hypothetical protein J3459_003969 [Metarhizium acridum]
MGGGEPEVTADIEHVAFFFSKKQLGAKGGFFTCEDGWVCAAWKGDIQFRGLRFGRRQNRTRPAWTGMTPLAEMAYKYIMELVSDYAHLRTSREPSMPSNRPCGESLLSSLS